MFNVTIGGTDVSALVRQKQLRIESALTSEVDTAVFQLVSPDNSYAPPEGEDVVITDAQGTRVFGGLLNSTMDFAVGAAGLGYDCECTDFTPDLDRRLLIENHVNLTAGAVVRDWVAKNNEYLPVGKQFTTAGVQDGPLVKSLRSNYQPMSLGMEKLHRLTGYEWYVDAYRDVKFFAQETLNSPVPLRARGAWAQTGEWWDLRIRRGPVTQIRSRAYIRGATYEGAEMILRFAGNGKDKVFYLGYLARDIRVYKNAVIQTLGLDNIAAGRDFYFNYEGMFVRQDEVDAALTSLDELQVLFIPMIPVRVVVADEKLIAQYGIREHMVQDQSIDTKELARLRGKLELKGKGINGTFQSFVRGWRAGQVFDINLPERRLTGVKGLVYKASLQYAGDMNQYLTTVQFEVI